jgi:hypothetical protein
MARLQTFHDVIRAFRPHPEVENADAEGLPRGRQTVGLLQRRIVQETYVGHVGKEANKLEEVEAVLIAIGWAYWQHRGNELFSASSPVIKASAS